MNWFINLKLSNKIMFVSMIMMVCAISWSAFNSYMGYRLMEQKTMETNKYLVEAASSMITPLLKDVRSGRMDATSAKEVAKAMLRASRYKGDQYYWINDMNGQAVMHPTIPALETQDLSQTNTKVNDLFLTFAKLVKETPTGAEHYYDWQKPGQPQDRLYPKSSYVMPIGEWGWVIGTGVYIDDLKNEAVKIFYAEMFFALLFGLTLAIGTYGAVRIVSRPLVRLSQNMRALAAGNIDVDVPYATRKDEVGLIAQSFAVFKTNTIEKVELEKKQEEMQRQAQEEKILIMNKIADDFESQISSALSNLGASADILADTAEDMTKTSEVNIQASMIVATAATEASTNVETVAAATEELSASSGEIASQIAGVAQRSAQAANEAEKAYSEVDVLKQQTKSIGGVVSAIKEIAEQTNLLALNATIEAARAGEAGKGFAVVADEVKKLATETAAKTSEIDEQVLKIQAAVNNSVNAMNQIIVAVKEIDQATTAVASAVEEQNVATSEIGRNVSDAAKGTQQVSQNIEDVKTNAQSTGQAAKDVESSAHKVSELAQTLSGSVQTFLGTIRSQA